MNSRLFLTCSLILLMCASARAQQGGPFFHQIYSATSADGLNWTHDGVMLLDHASVPCAIVLQDGRIRLYYVDASTVPEGTNCAESTDGGRSFRALGCKIEKKSSYKALDPSIVQLKDGRFRLYFYASQPDPNTPGPHSIMSAISSDGVNFTEEGEVFSYDGLVDPDVFAVGNKWLMYVFSLKDFKTVIARSKRSGVNFKYVQPLGLEGWGTTAPVKLDDGSFRLYAFNQRGSQYIGSFISRDGINWTQESGVRLTAPTGKEITDPFVVRLPDGSWKMFFKISADNKPPSNWEADPKLSQTDFIVIGSRQVASSSRLLAEWQAPAQKIDHYEVTYTDSVTLRPTTISSTETRAILKGLKADTEYSVKLRACVDASCQEVLSYEKEVSARTEKEHWQVQGSGGSAATAQKIVSDGNVNGCPMVFGDWAGDLAGRVQLYYNPILAEEKGVKIALSEGRTDSLKSISQFNPLPGFGLKKLCSNAPNQPPCNTTSEVASIALFQAIPLSPEMGGGIRLFFEAEGSDRRTRIFSIDSKDGYVGRDFNAGPSTICSSAADFAAGGNCAVQVEIGVEGDSVRPNAKIRNARQFKLLTPNQEDGRWDGRPGTFMIFTYEPTNQKCQGKQFRQGYAVWSGSEWKVQYDSTGCPKTFDGLQAPAPVYAGSSSYKLYFNYHESQQPNPDQKPVYMIYANSAQTGDLETVDFEDWEPVSAKRQIVYLWPDGNQLTSAETSRFDDYFIFAPTGDPNTLVMYTNMSGQGVAPFIGMVTLLNP